MKERGFNPSSFTSQASVPSYNTGIWKRPLFGRWCEVPASPMKEVRDAPPPPWTFHTSRLLEETIHALFPWVLLYQWIKVNHRNRILGCSSLPVDWEGWKGPYSPTSSLPPWDILGHNVMARIPLGRGRGLAAEVTLLGVEIHLPWSYLIIVSM